MTADLAGRLTASVTICRTHFTQEEIAGLTEEMSRLCRRDMDLPEITHCRTVTMLTLVSGRCLRRSSIAAAPAAAERVSGDALDQFFGYERPRPDAAVRRHGHRTAAAVDGQMAAKRQPSCCGPAFAAESAARLVNVAAWLKGAEQEAGATPLDLLTVDLYTGRAGVV